MQLVVAGILLQTLFFKFTAADESVHIFSALGQFLGVAGVEPWGRIGSGVVELIASVLLLVSATASMGALVAIRNEPGTFAECVDASSPETGELAVRWVEHTAPFR